MNRHPAPVCDERPRMLYIHPGPVPPHPDPRRNALFHLSAELRGDLVTTSWRSRRAHREKRAEDEAALGSFGYHATVVRRGGILKSAYDLAYFVAMGLWLSATRGRYDVVVSYGLLRTGLAAWLVSRLTGTRLIVQVPGDPRQPMRSAGAALERMRAGVSRAVAFFVLRRAARAHLLYPTQLDGIRGVERVPRSVFHDFVPVALVPNTGRDEGYILFLGYPWHLKGVDVLIKAFLRIADQFPDHCLRIVGHCPDRTEFEALAGGHPRIHLEKAVPNADAMALLAGCTLFVLPSRTEAMGRVLLEAMAAGKAIVASDVDGIPFYVRDGETGLLFRSEDAEGLAEALMLLLGDAKLRTRMSQTGHRLVCEHLTEKRHAQAFCACVRATIDANLRRPAGSSCTKRPNGTPIC